MSFYLLVFGDQAFQTYLHHVVETWSGRRKPTEAFSFECEVTAHQTATISTTAVMVVAADFFTYKSSSLLFHTGDVENPILTGSAWSKFELGCAPEISWLSINSNTGTLTYTGSSGSPGALVLNLSSFISIKGFMMLADLCPGLVCTERLICQTMGICSMSRWFVCGRGQVLWSRWGSLYCACVERGQTVS